jgi:hypothetical protein
MQIIRRTDTSEAIEPTAISSTVTKDNSSTKNMYFDMSGSASPNETTVPNFRAARVFEGQQQQQQQPQPQPQQQGQQPSQQQTQSSILTPTIIDALVKSIARLIMTDSATGTPKPMSLQTIKTLLRQYHNIQNPSDVAAVVKAFQQAHPDVKVATLETAFKEFQKMQYAAASNNSSSSSTITPPPSSSSLPLQQQYQQKQLSPQDQAMVNTIVKDLLNNELAAGGGTYTTTQLIQIINRKYPMVTTEVVMGVLDNLAGQKAKVASVTECAWDNPVTYWWNRNCSSRLV